MSNTGNRNTGDLNTGYRNKWHLNTWDRNMGDRNAWYRNTGDRNTGYLNAWNRNAGNRNAGNRNAGYLNSDTPKIGIFWVQTDMDYWDISFPDWFYFNTILRVSEISMTAKEKEENPVYWITKWYLKKLSQSTNRHEYMKDCWRLAFDKCEDLDDIRKTLDLPHFSYEKFEEISWISEKDFERKLGKKVEIEKMKDTMVIDWVTYKRQD